MNITIVGAGNIGTQFAVHCSEKGHEVTMFGSKPELIQKELTILNERDEVIHRGEIREATKDPQEAFAEAELIFVIMPATMMRKNAELITPYVRPGMKICLVPGTGGGECAFKEAVKKGAVLFGVQRVPSVARLVEYGKSVRAIGYRGEMFAAALPQAKTKECCSLIEHILDIPCTPLPNYLNITLTPSNPILHTTRLRVLYKDYQPGYVYSEVPLFYEGWTDETSELMLKCDAEVQQICRKLDTFDLSYVRSLKDHYESYTESAMTAKIRSITGFKGLTSPAIAVEGGFIPDFASRYFTADFSFGLVILLQIADFLGLEVPNMRETQNWYEKLANPLTVYHFSDFGINNLEDFAAFYQM